MRRDSRGKVWETSGEETLGEINHTSYMTKKQVQCGKSGREEARQAWSNYCPALCSGLIKLKKKRKKKGGWGCYSMV